MEYPFPIHRPGGTRGRIRRGPICLMEDSVKKNRIDRSRESDRKPVLVELTLGDMKRICGGGFYVRLPKTGMDEFGLPALVFPSK
jgi:hypothetical protein